MCDRGGGLAAVRQWYYIDFASILKDWFAVDSQGVGTKYMMFVFNFAATEKTRMRHYLTVVDVLQLYPTRKKSWAYKQLQAVRDATNKPQALVKDFAEHVGLSESELRALLSKVD